MELQQISTPGWLSREMRSPSQGGLHPVFNKGEGLLEELYQLARSKKRKLN